ncbi:phosphatase PAP2 family protein [Singulisphaera acidiphila]|uniref:Membrane-associated phospholipid phosphatase n=1 Tax=Singulisphaera acidiphila (strain ATCC BAA-1392 / DSM 18658 / VKM B-2454 / MOB10) TaxID=886293 RepID=L0DLD3_SINAD|nr:phosphatase PAP2 family protein [Singulisphaera acidiphila]AGA30052.1 membrane-associated phospholipid phosphatase [Singulisphaera acidiphila DSM 18658]
MPDRGAGRFWLASAQSKWMTFGCALLVLAALICIVGMLGHSGRVSEATDFDVVLHRWVVAHRGDWPKLTWSMLLVTRFGDPPFAIASTVAAMLWIYSLHRRSIAGIRRSEVLVWLWAILGAWYLGSVLKLYFKRERPPLIDRLVNEGLYSFPSGHSVFAGAFYTTMALLLSRLIPSSRRWRRRFAVVLCLFAALTIALSRVWLGVHYPTDVLAGLLIGSSTVLGVWLARISRAHPQPSGQGDQSGSRESSGREPFSGG